MEIGARELQQFSSPAEFSSVLNIRTNLFSVQGNPSLNRLLGKPRHYIYHDIAVINF